MQSSSFTVCVKGVTC